MFKLITKPESHKSTTCFQGEWWQVMLNKIWKIFLKICGFEIKNLIHVFILNCPNQQVCGKWCITGQHWFMSYTLAAQSESPKLNVKCVGEVVNQSKINCSTYVVVNRGIIFGKICLWLTVLYNTCDLGLNHESKPLGPKLEVKHSLSFLFSNLFFRNAFQKKLQNHMNIVFWKKCRKLWVFSKISVVFSCDQLIKDT